MIMMTDIKIEVPREKIAAFCQQNHIKKLAFFGSVLRDDFRPDSDVDVLVEFEKGYTPGFAYIRMQRELSALLDGREIDMVTPKFLHPRIKKIVEKEMRIAYA